ncbi:hypothetical protein FRC11_003621 [Ceratobasidium sp. 423]|nr:hypothetical protein FRC11_003621 [Ceratobasidium sp. 423]
MQGGRARKNLAYSVYTGDLNEDDCEELMFEISRWALRGERWACGEGASLEGGESMDQESGEGEGTSQQVKEGGESQKESEVREAVEDTSSLQQTQEDERIVEETKAPSNTEDVEMQDATQETSETSTPATEQDPQSETKSGDSTELEDDPLTVVRNLEQMTPLTPSTRGDFRSLVKLQPPRPVGSPDYEGLTPEERMGYVSDVLYPEAAALILSYRRGIRTQPGPLVDPAAERALHTAGLQAAKNTCSTFDWVEQILAVRQLRESNSKYQVEEQTQVVVAGGTKSRPKFMTSVFK